jgi:hypothetical protein
MFNKISLDQNVLALLLSLIIFSFPVYAQQSSDSFVASSNSKDESAIDTKSIKNNTNLETLPLFSGYLGIQVGVDKDTVHKKLGIPTSSRTGLDSYEISKKKSIHIYYDEKDQVKALCITFIGKNSDAPSAKMVIGEELEKGTDGGQYKLVRYPEAGYWVSYSRINGDDPVVTVMMQKMSQDR